MAHACPASPADDVIAHACLGSPAGDVIAHACSAAPAGCTYTGARLAMGARRGPAKCSPAQLAKGHAVLCCAVLYCPRCALLLCCRRACLSRGRTAGRDAGCACRPCLRACLPFACRFMVSVFFSLISLARPVPNRGAATPPHTLVPAAVWARRLPPTSALRSSAPGFLHPGHASSEIVNLKLFH